MLTYMCEARPTETTPDKETCHFPFVHNGNTYDTCAQNEDSLTLGADTKGKPFCALKVDATETMVAGEWGVCKDERTIAYAKTLDSDEVTGQFCSLPFKLNKK